MGPSPSSSASRVACVGEQKTVDNKSSFSRGMKKATKTKLNKKCRTQCERELNNVWSGCIGGSEKELSGILCERGPYLAFLNCNQLRGRKERKQKLLDHHSDSDLHAQLTLIKTWNRFFFGFDNEIGLLDVIRGVFIATLKQFVTQNVSNSSRTTDPK